MLKLIKKFLYKPTTGISFLIITIFFLSYILTIILKDIFNDFNYLAFYLISLLSVFIILELTFVFLYLIKNRIFYSHPPKVNFNKIPYKGHPYIPYLLKENVDGAPPAAYNYPLHKGKYKLHKVKTNNLGFLNGENGDKDVSFVKEDNSIRINCIGSSTTMNYLLYEDKVYSYPLELEKQLKMNSKKNYEVNNCGQGGYNSADIMIRLLLQILDTKPDMIILYQGHADIRSYLSNDFKSDYSHSRYNLSEFYGKLKFNTSIPKMPFSFLNFLIGHWFPYNIGISLVDLIHKKGIDLNANPNHGLKTFERNLQLIIDICNAKKIDLILSTYCHILHNKVKHSLLHKKYAEIMDKENQIIKELAKKNKSYFIDNANLVPKDEKYFVDTIHFSHKGMENIAENFANKVKSIYEK
tara:strand:- start:279 stop:1511 length:1233 start_codon:yes stop_codon:yes gene_type:complete